MRILTMADKESKNYWDFYKPGKLEGIDIIISCGDLDPRYLSFLATFTHAPVVFVHGNHDDKYDRIPPDGCMPIEDTIWVYQGIRFLGLGGSMKYKTGNYQYTQEEMTARVKRLKKLIKKNDGFDVMVTHSPAFHVGDGSDLPHMGFEAFRELLDTYSPRYFLHGHVHPTYSREFRKYRTYKDTLIINPFESHIFEYETEHEEQFDRVRGYEQKRMAELNKISGEEI